MDSNKNRVYGAGEMALWLKVHANLAEGLRSVPITHMVTHNHPKLQFQGLLWPSLASVGIVGPLSTYMQAKY